MRPIDADALVASLEESYKELRKLYDSTKDDDGAKDVYQGELITFLEAILRTRNAPTIDCEPVRHGFWVLQDDTYTNRMCSVCESPNHDGWESYCPNCGAKMDARMDGGKENG